MRRVEWENGCCAGGQRGGWVGQLYCFGGWSGGGGGGHCSNASSSVALLPSAAHWQS
jgi:hypothetical protein